MYRKTELFHYGTPRHSGRYPWGSGDRPYQDVKRALKGKDRGPYFNEKRTIPKGTKMYRVTSDDDPIQRSKGIYVTYLEADRDMYRKGFIRKRNKTDNAYETEMVTTEELKIPSEDEYKETISRVIKNNPKLATESAENYLKLVSPESIQTKEVRLEDLYTGDVTIKKYDDYVKELSNKLSEESIYDTWSDIAVTLGHSDNLRNAIIEDLSKKGYNAISDWSSVGGQGNWKIEGIDPLIIFDKKNHLMSSIHLR